MSRKLVASRNAAASRNSLASCWPGRMREKEREREREREREKLPKVRRSARCSLLAPFLRFSFWPFGTATGLRRSLTKVGNHTHRFHAAAIQPPRLQGGWVKRCLRVPFCPQSSVHTVQHLDTEVSAWTFVGRKWQRKKKNIVRRRGMWSCEQKRFARWTIYEYIISLPLWTQSIGDSWHWWLFQKLMERLVSTASYQIRHVDFTTFSRAIILNLTRLRINTPFRRIPDFLAFWTFTDFQFLSCIHTRIRQYRQSLI